MLRQERAVPLEPPATVVLPPSCCQQPAVLSDIAADRSDAATATSRDTVSDKAYACNVSSGCNRTAPVASSATYATATRHMSEHQPVDSEASCAIHATEFTHPSTAITILCPAESLTATAHMPLVSKAPTGISPGASACATASDAMSSTTSRSTVDVPPASSACAGASPGATACVAAAVSCSTRRTSLATLPSCLQREVLSWCSEAATANALAATCRGLSHLRDDPAASALLLLRHEYADTVAVGAALAACHKAWPPAFLKTVLKTLLGMLLAAPDVGAAYSASQPLLNGLLYGASGAGDVALMRRLLALPRPPDVHAGREDALKLAIFAESLAAVRVLLQHGADPCADDGRPLICASETPGRATLLPLLLQHCPLLPAVTATATATAFLVRSTDDKAAANVADEAKAVAIIAATAKACKNALSFAVYKDNVPAVLVLLPTVPLARGACLDQAAYDGSLGVLRLLADGSSSASHGSTSRSTGDAAGASGYVGGAYLDSSSVSACGATAGELASGLQCACLGGQAACTALLLDLGAEVNADGHRALHHAVCQHGGAVHASPTASEAARLDVVQLLLRRGAVVTPVSVAEAEKAGLTQVARVMLQAMLGGQ